MKKQSYPEPAAGGFIVNKKGEILFVKSYEWKELWHIPGGHVETGERIVDALRREVMEEVGLKVRPTRLLSIQEALFPKANKGKKHLIYFDFLCEAETSNVKIDRKEIKEYKWFKPSEAKKLSFDPFTKHSLQVYLSAKYVPTELEKKILTQ